MVSAILLINARQKVNIVYCAVGLVSIVPDSVLVPGDRFIVTQGMTLPCDAVLVSGRVVADESMLTGESVPVSKAPIDIAELGESVVSFSVCFRSQCHLHFSRRLLS